MAHSHGTDMQGRPYLTFAQAQAGTTVELDDGFTCVDRGDLRELKSDDSGLYFRCREGQHFLDGQEADAGDFYLGVYPAEKPGNGA